MPPKGKSKKDAKAEDVTDATSDTSFPPAGPLKPHISAPSYLQSLATNDLPPFKPPWKEARPVLLVGPTVMVTEDDVVEIIAASDKDLVNGLNKALGQLVLKKNVINNFDLIERNFLINFLTETVDYAAQRDFSGFKLSILFTIYLTTHLYFKWYYWSPRIAIWNYFKELMIRHTVESSPDSQEVFDPNECYDIITHFHTMYMSNLPLIHILTFGSHRLRLTWPFKLSKGEK